MNHTSDSVGKGIEQTFEWWVNVIQYLRYKSFLGIIYMKFLKNKNTNTYVNKLN